MYILYATEDMEEFGIWKVSPDMSTQTCVYYSDGSLDSYDNGKNTVVLDKILDMGFVDQAQISILTRDQAAEIVLLNG